MVKAKEDIQCCNAKVPYPLDPIPYFFVPKEMRLPWALHYSDFKQSLNDV